MKNTLLLAYCLTTLALYPPIGTAQIYKYKDANGNWQFSDRPPVSDQQVEQLDLSGRKADTVATDIRQQLLDKYQPQTAVEETTLAVVSIETKLGSGSGFFVSDDGYIVTNKHVIRPTDNPNWKQTADQYKAAKRQIAEAETRLASRRARLSDMENELNQYKRDIESYSGREKSLATSEYEFYRGRYLDMKRDYDEAKRHLDKQKREFSKASSEFNANSTSAKLAQRFNVVLKDGSKVSARLISTSAKHDLALLKLNGYRTPHLDITRPPTANQGMTVYAVGSPLGLQDTVTSGIVTRLQTDKIYTDTQILPGNSGGPLIDEKGRVLGVNSQKLLATKSIGSEGFGVSIPVKYVSEEFGGVIAAPAIDAVR